MNTQEPRLAYFYNLKKLILKDILSKGPDAPANSGISWSEGWSRDVTLAIYLLSIERMIEAMAALRDFEKEPLTEKEDSDLNEIWLLEQSLS